MGSGKSVIARELSRITGASIIQMDVIRKELFEIDPRERRLDDFGQGIYSEDFTRLVYEKSLASAKKILESGKSVIIDASYKRKEHRLAAYDMAKGLKSDFFVMECICTDRCARERLARRIQDKNEASDGRPEIEGCVDRAIAFITGTETSD
jgi:predicted kinase